MKWLAILLLMIAAPRVRAEEPTAVCSVGDLTACRDCSALERALQGESLDAGEYFHGLLRNGLFAAFFLDCQALGERLLRRGADPSVGGLFGSMALSLSSRWPQNNKATNERWAALLLQYWIKADVKTYIDELPATELVSKSYASPDYPDIWDRLVHGR